MRVDGTEYLRIGTGGAVSLPNSDLTLENNNGALEGPQINFAGWGTTYTKPAFIDRYQDWIRILNDSTSQSGLDIINIGTADAKIRIQDGSLEITGDAFIHLHERAGMGTPPANQGYLFASSGELYYRNNSKQVVLTNNWIGTAASNLDMQTFDIRGDFANPSFNTRTAFVCRTTNANTVVTAKPNGTAALAGFAAYAQGDITNGSGISLVATSTVNVVSTAVNGTGSVNPIELRIGSTSYVKLDNTNEIVEMGKPVKFPSLTTTERDNLTPAAGWTIFNSTTSKLETYDGSNWQAHW
jgi:hypothetical protein